MVLGTACKSGFHLSVSTWKFRIPVLLIIEIMWTFVCLVSVVTESSWEIH